MELQKASLIIAIIPLALFQISAQRSVKLDTTNYKDYIKSLPAFTMYGDNYFSTGTSLTNNSFSSETSDAKFEIGFKQRLTNLDLPWDVFPFITYRQKSFWDIYLESFPFRETNYNPSLGIAKLFVGPNGIQGGLWLAFEHESNGRDGDNSRSWNYFSLQYLKPLNDHWQVRAKTWIPIGSLDGNPDILSFRGFFSLGATFAPSPKLIFDVDVQPAFDDQLTGFVKASCSFKISKNSNQFIYLQYYGGYSEELIDYDQSVSNLRLGIVFKDLMGTLLGITDLKSQFPP